MKTKGYLVVSLDSSIVPWFHCCWFTKPTLVYIIISSIFFYISLMRSSWLCHWNSYYQKGYNLKNSQLYSRTQMSIKPFSRILPILTQSETCYLYFCNYLSILLIVTFWSKYFHKIHAAFLFFLLTTHRTAIVR